MENSAANQLPEVGSLADGFVESGAESIAPLTPLNENEKTINKNSEHRLTNEVGEKEFIAVQGKVEKAPKVCTFSVQLSDKDGYDASGESAGVSDDGIGPKSVTSASAVSERGD